MAPSSRAGIWWSSSFWMAAASLPMAPCTGGIEECPPSLWATSSTLRIPFSAVPIIAAGRSTPGIEPSTMAPPSSRMNAGRTPRCSSSFAIAAAPLRPPTSSSCPKAK